MVNGPPFRLTKWYLDCVSETGDAAIFYGAHVSWRGIHLRYSSLLCHLEGHITCKTSVGAPFPTQPNENTLAIEAPQLGITGTWDRLDPRVDKNLYEDNGGVVHWDCVQPRAAAQLRIGDHALEGLGYAECLTLTIPPWRLPLQSLQWGRWLSPTGGLIWIVWTGPSARSWIWRNGAESIDISEVQLDKIVGLQLDRGVTLRDGRLGKTVLPAAPFLARIFPRAIFGIHETKWLSRGTLARAGTPERGWAIHEVVEWNT